MNDKEIEGSSGAVAMSRFKSSKYKNAYSYVYKKEVSDAGKLGLTQKGDSSLASSLATQSLGCSDRGWG